MKAVVFHDREDIRLDDVPDPHIEHASDAIIRVTTSAICGTDLHFVRGTVEGMKPGTILGHEAVGVVEELGEDVRNLRIGDRVVVASTIACGNCSYCRASYYSQCDNANPNGKEAGTAFYGGPTFTGPFAGLQAEKARIPFAHVGLVKLPDDVSDEQAIMLSDIFPTGYFGAEQAEVSEGDTVAVFGCGPVGQFAIASAKLMGASRVFAIDRFADRLATAQRQGAEIINFDQEDPVAAIKRLTGGVGVDRAIDAVGVDAECPHPQDRPSESTPGPNWQPGDKPTQALQWAVEALAKAGSLAIIGVYPPGTRDFPIGMAMNKNLTMKMGNCPHRRYIPWLIELTQSGRIDPTKILSHDQPLSNAIDAFKAFDRRERGWIKVALSAESSHEQEKIDEAVDESFPASDPPSTSIP